MAKIMDFDMQINLLKKEREKKIKLGQERTCTCGYISLAETLIVIGQQCFKNGFVSLDCSLALVLMQLTNGNQRSEPWLCLTFFLLMTLSFDLLHKCMHLFWMRAPTSLLGGVHFRQRNFRLPRALLSQ